MAEHPSEKQAHEPKSLLATELEKSAHLCISSFYSFIFFHNVYILTYLGTIFLGSRNLEK